MITQGKWQFEKYENITVFADNDEICELYDGDQLANARLISAAPEMLKALKRAESYYRENKNTKNMNGPEYGIWHNIISIIEKVEGNENGRDSLSGYDE